MKKIIAIIICVGALAILAGCGNDQYAIEKQYWQAQKQADKIFKNPNASPPRELERVVKLLTGFSEKHPNTNLAIDADFNIARLYIVKEAYEQSRSQLRIILNKYRANDAICAEALFLSGNAYQIEGKWNLALEQYKKILQEYPKTGRGIDIPIYIAQYYKIKYQPDKMIAAYQEAIAHYQALAAKYPDSLLAYSADMLATQCFIALKDWQNAINSFNAMLEKYKAAKVNKDNLLMSIALLYAKELKDQAMAKQTLERLLNEYPKSRLIKTATELLKEMGKKWTRWN